MTHQQLLSLGLAIGVPLGLSSLACTDDGTTGETRMTTETGDDTSESDGDGDQTGDGDGDGDQSGDGDGDPAPFCGDGVIDEGEECDAGQFNADDNVCTSQCIIAVCGDGLIWTGMEDCDDSNEDSTDACVEGCVAASCEDGFLYAGVETDIDCGGEVCDACGIGLACVEGTDCLSELCDDTMLCALTTTTTTITITNEGQDPLIDWQVPVDLDENNFSYGKATVSGADLRFSTDGVNADIPHWIETYAPGGDSRIWVKVPLIPADGSVDITLIYGDADAIDASDGDATFEFFDDFEDGDYADKWTIGGNPTATEQDGELSITGNFNWEYAASIASFDYEIEVHADLLAEGPSAGLIIADDDSDLRYTFRRSVDEITGVTWDPDIDGDNAFESAAFPGVPFTQNESRRVTCAFRLVGERIGIDEYCDQANCSASFLLSRTPFTGYRVGISNHNINNGPVRSQLMFVTKHGAQELLVAVN